MRHLISKAIQNIHTEAQRLLQHNSELHPELENPSAMDIVAAQISANTYVMVSMENVNPANITIVNQEVDITEKQP